MAKSLGDYEDMTQKKLTEFAKIEFILHRLTLAKSSFNLNRGHWKLG